MPRPTQKSTMRKTITKPRYPVLPWRSILVPIDFSPTSLDALDIAVPIARDAKASVLLLSVVESPAQATALEGVFLSDEVIPTVKETKLKLLALAKRQVPASISRSCSAIRGKPSDTITRFAKDQRIDLIVLATHGYTGFEHFILGSTAEHVVRDAPCAVLVIPPRH